ncbi:MAG: helix-turn-helix domain-containing protein [Candidatus Melainabacteria bacterium]|nr:helix-turn-helix domain-containing protein [Candidatus Melainabacteria bacterium]
MNANTIGSAGLASIVVPTEQQSESLWTTAQAAQVLNRPERSVRRLVQKGDIKGFKVKGKFGEEWRIMPFAYDPRTEANVESEEYSNNNLCFEVPKEHATNKVVDDANTQQSTPSVWKNVFGIFKSMQFWISKGEKTVTQIVEY